MYVYVNMSAYGYVHKSVVPTEASRDLEVEFQVAVSHLKWVPPPEQQVLLTLCHLSNPQKIILDNNESVKQFRSEREKEQC